jgi:AcrR family transcriptional regulator
MAGAQTMRPGRNGLDRGRLVEIQRSRIASAMIDAVAERGLAGASVAHVVQRSGVSRRTFYEIFEDREDCFLAALDDAISRAGEHVIAAYETAGRRWAERIRAGLTAFLSFLDAEPAAGRLLVVGSLGAGPSAHRRRQRVLDRVTSAIEEGREEAKTPGDLPKLTGEGAVGAVLGVVYARMSEGKCPPLAGLSGPLMGMIVLPYLGPAAARRETARPAPQPPTAPATPAASIDPLRDLPMRLTYRTVTVLLAIGSQPGASNRAIALAAGVEDQGQISKLLARLAKLGLIANGRDIDARGAGNSWTLTELGETLERSLLR